MFNRDYKELLSLFIDHRVDFMVVGAYALAAHGIVRATGDIDLFIAANVNNSTKVYAALAAFGAPLSGISSADFAAEGIVYQMGVVPCRIDVITAIDGVAFSTVEKIYRDIEGLQIPFIDRQSLITNKRASGRAKDLIDLELLGNSTGKP